MVPGAVCLTKTLITSVVFFFCFKRLSACVDNVSGGDQHRLAVQGRFIGIYYYNKYKSPSK